MLLHFSHYSMIISKLVTNYNYTDGMLFDSEEPLNDILMHYYEGIEEEDFITLIAEPLKQMEKTIRTFNKIGNQGKAQVWDIDKLRDAMDSTIFGTTDFSNLDTSKLSF